MLPAVVLRPRFAKSQASQVLAIFHLSLYRAATGRHNLPSELIASSESVSLSLAVQACIHGWLAPSHLFYLLRANVDPRLCSHGVPSLTPPVYSHTPPSPAHKHEHTRALRMPMPACTPMPALWSEGNTHTTQNSTTTIARKHTHTHTHTHTHIHHMGTGSSSRERWMTLLGCCWTSNLISA